MITETKIAEVWNKKADEYNPWSDLGTDEKIAFIIEYVAKQCAGVCDDELSYHEGDGDIFDALMNVKGVIEQMYNPD